MITINISINLEAGDPAQLGAQLGAVLRGIQAIADVYAETGAPSDETTTRGGNGHAQPQTAKPAATTTTQKRRGRPPKAFTPTEDRAAFDKLVRGELKRLSMGERMPSAATWNNERDVRLPTMAGILEAYSAADLIELAMRLGMRPPMSALGVEPFAEVAT